MVAVGFNPRGGGKMARRRGATLEGLMARPSAGSGVATRRCSDFPSVRGLKPTAIVMTSLCEAEPAVPWNPKSEIRPTHESGTTQAGSGASDVAQSEVFYAAIPRNVNNL